MSDSERKYFSGNTVEQAVMQAARHYEVKPAEVVFKELKKKHGFLRKRRGVIIEVDPDAPTGSGDVQGSPGEVAEELDSETLSGQADQPGLEEEVSSPDAPTASETPPTPAWEVEIDEEVSAAAGKALDEIFEMSGLKLEYEISEGEGQLEIELWGDDQEILLEDRGNLLLGIQHLMPRLIRGICGRSAPCRVDSDDFHATHESELEDLALRVAGEVHERSQPRTLHPMNPAERRIIHVTLASNEDVDTESQGRGFYKRVTIRPVRRRPRGFDRYS